MYILFECVVCAVLVFGAMAALFAASVICIIVKERTTILAQLAYTSVHHARHMLTRCVGFGAKLGQSVP
jgi:hypothetical protein